MNSYPDKGKSKELIYFWKCLIRVSQEQIWLLLLMWRIATRLPQHFCQFFLLFALRYWWLTAVTGIFPCGIFPGWFFLGWFFPVRNFPSGFIVRLCNSYIKRKAFMLLGKFLTGKNPPWNVPPGKIPTIVNSMSNDGFDYCMGKQCCENWCELTLFKKVQSHWDERGSFLGANLLK